MKIPLRWPRAGTLAVLVLVVVLSACAGREPRVDYRWVDGAKISAGAGMAVQWALDLAPPMSGPYVPVEQASPGIDRRSGRVYVGSTRGALWGLDAQGHIMFRYDTKAPVEAQPVVDPITGEVYAATVRGTLLAVRGEDASVRWRTQVGGAVSEPALLSKDAVYVVTDADSVVAVSRADGSVLWRYHREPREGFTIAGHAGLTEANGKLLTGFGDGSVVALDASDGRVVWEVDTSLELEDLDPTRRFTDVDTTPVVAGDLVYVASFSGGLYALQLANGNIQHHYAELRAISGLAASRDVLLISSAEYGVVCLDLPTLALRWKYPIKRGSPSQAEIRGDNVYVTESLGGFLVLALSDGKELGRLETAHGITAPATLDSGKGFVLSNASTLYAFRY